MTIVGRNIFVVIDVITMRYTVIIVVVGSVVVIVGGGISSVVAFQVI